MKLSVIIPTLNNLSLTRQLFSSFEATKPSMTYEVIIIDNASTDGTKEYLSTLEKSYRVVYLNAQQSYAKNNNYGARIAIGETLAFLNNDLILTQNWLPPMINLLDTMENVGAVGNIQIQPQTSLIDHAGIAFDLNGVPFHIRKNRKKLPAGAYHECNAITGACMLIKRGLFVSIGGFDERYWNGSEDVDLCVRLRLTGFRLLVSHYSQIYHHVSSSAGRFDNIDTNMNLFLSKWQSRTAAWGLQEWAPEYFHRYARHFWKMTPNKVAKALYMIGKNRHSDKKDVYHSSV